MKLFHAPASPSVRKVLPSVIARTLDPLEREADSLTGPFTTGSITVACAPGDLDFRFGHEPWREAHPRLAVWFESAAKHRAFVETAPVAPG